MTPEEYTAFAIVKAAAVMLGVIPCLFLFPLLALVVILLAVMVYFKEIRRADEKLSGKRDEIESELPRFVATITQELANSRDVLSMVEHYKPNAGATFAAELDILTADMRSGSYEAALTRFEARFNSPLLSDVVRGLIGEMCIRDRFWVCSQHCGEAFWAYHSPSAMLPHGPALKSTALPHQHQSAKLPSPWLPFFPLVLPFSMFWRL